MGTKAVDRQQAKREEYALSQIFNPKDICKLVEASRVLLVALRPLLRGCAYCRAFNPAKSKAAA